MLSRLLKRAFSKAAVGGAFRGSPNETGAPNPDFAQPYLAYLLMWESPVRVSPDSDLYAPLASTRLRVLVPGRELARIIATWILPLQRLLGGEAPPGAAPVAAILGKLPIGDLLGNPQIIRTLIDWLDRHADRLRLFADVSDDYRATGQPVLCEYLDALLRTCTLVVPCEALKNELAPHARRGIHVVEDAYELPRGVPRAYRGGRMRLCWFGAFVGPTRAAIERMLGDIVAHLRDRDLRFEFVTGPAQQRDGAQRLGVALREIHPRLEFTVSDWSRESTERALADCHFALLPQDADSEWGRVKSHNRLVETIRAGRFGLAAPIPSYLELRDFAWVGRDLCAGIDWAAANPDEAEKRITAGQEYVEARFAPAAVASKWAAVLGITAEAGGRAFADGTPALPAPGGAASTAARPLRVALYSLDAPNFPCARLRVLDPAAANGTAIELRRAVDVRNDGIALDLDLLEWCDVVLVQRGFPGCSAHEAGIVERIVRAGKPIVYETDDDFAAIPDWHGKPHHRETAPWIERFLQHVALVTVSTEVLRERFGRLHDHVLVLPNYVNEALWPVDAPVASRLRNPHILYAGSRGHWKDLEVVEALLAETLQRHRDVRLTIAGVDRTALAGHARVELLPFDGSYERYPRRLADLGASFAVVPLLDHPFNHSRSPIKFLEFAAVGIPGVFQDLPPYSAVRDGEDGLKAAGDPIAWRDAIDRLVADDDLRQRLAEAANRRVREEFLLSQHAHRWLAAWRSVLR
jgi:glycosyltransferase involved in cell wall biosynthesis